jgi:peroxiredoxin Q/BCP
MAKEIHLKLKEGDLAPEFFVNTNGGGKISLADYKGRNVILYFYPKDDTPGCTKEACAFRDHFADFKKKGAVIFGVSTDPVKSHDKFVEKFKLPFTLPMKTKRSSKLTACGAKKVSWAANTWARTA